jgi:hypothetical protein
MAVTPTLIEVTAAGAGADIAGADIEVRTRAAAKTDEIRALTVLFFIKFPPIDDIVLSE